MCEKDNYNSSVAELERLTQQKLHQAEEEHKALTSTVRQRLVASITKKRGQLLRDKEQLDIADSNAMLLHPNHFSINNPGSPGGGQNRKTRHLRHRATSPSGEAGENGKRKRKAAAIDDDGNESPAPAFRPLPPPDALGGGRSPFKDAREKNAYTQYEAPAYSLERIFTDKELSMATATAQQATYRYFHQPQHHPQPQPQDRTSNTNGTATAAPSVDGEVLLNPADPNTAVDGEEGAAAHPTTETLPAGSPPLPPAPAAQEMERTTSHQVLTRGHVRANPLAALSDLATAAAGVASAPVRDNPFAPVVPSYHAVTRSEKSGAPAPPGVGGLDIENDFEMMRRAGSPAPPLTDADGLDADETMTQNDDTAVAVAGKEMRRQLLDQALGNSTVTQPYRLPLLETGPAVIPRGVERPSWTGFAPQGAFEQQQRLRQQIAANVGVGGGSMAAALQGRIAGGLGLGGGVLGGGEAMSRTTSAGGGSEVGGGGGEVPVGVVAATAGVGGARRGRGRLV